MMAIQKQAEGKYRVVVYAGIRDPFTKRRRQLSGTATSAKAARLLESELLERAGDERDRGSAETTLARLIERWWAAGPALAPTTRKNYRENIDRHILPALGDRKLKAIRPLLVAEFLRHLSQDKGLAAGTVRKVRTVLSSLMAYAVAMELVADNAVMKVPPPSNDDEGDRPAPTMEECALILLTAEEMDPDLVDYLWVAAEEGGRRGETLHLRWGDIDWERSTIKIAGVISQGDDGVKARRQTKTKKDRSIALSSFTIKRLEARRERVEAMLSEARGEHVSVARTAYVFSGGGGSRRTPLDGKHWRPDSTSRRFKKVKERAGVNSDIDLHGLRKTMITEMLASGVDPRTVMGRAGHTTPGVTLGIYAEVRPQIDSAAAELWGSLLSAKLEDAAKEKARADKRESVVR